MNVVVTTTGTLIAAIQTARGGDTILVAPGTYDWFQLHDIHVDGGVTITSQDARNPATLSSLNFYNSSGLTFSDLNIKMYEPQNSEALFIGSSNITLDHLTMIGPSTDRTGPGVALANVTNAKVLNSDISGFGSGIGLSGGDGIVVQGNTIHDVAADGIDVVGTSNVTITGNTFRDFKTAPGAHADAIQFFTNGSSYSNPHDITISNNTIIRGAGSLFQGIFLEVDGRDPYQNITIQNNALFGTMFNGIFVQAANNVHIDHNLVAGFTDEPSWIYAESITDLSVTNNEANIYKVTYDTNPLPILTNNITIASPAIGDTGLLTTFGGSVGAPALSSPAGAGSTSIVSSGGGGDQTLTAHSVDASLQGGSGNDSIVSAGGHTYLRGGDGDDQIVGGTGFDDINGNAGNDTISAGAGDDWALGGQANDSISGGDGDDLVYGNLGNDTLDGGAGADTVRGGQGDDVIKGGVGNDWLSGDLGNDTMTGGAGADIFHSFVGTGIDVVTDFNIADGDKVQLDPGTPYSVSQVGTDVIIKLGTAGDEMILQNVKLTQLTTGWIFGA